MQAPLALKPMEELRVGQRNQEPGVNDSDGCPSNIVNDPLGNASLFAVEAYDYSGSRDRGTQCQKTPT